MAPIDTVVEILALLSNFFGRDLVVILVIAVLLMFGGRKLPTIARAIKRIPGSFRKGLEEDLHALLVASPAKWTKTHREIE